MRLSRAALRALRAAAARALPDECCGALLACAGEPTVVRRVVRLPNRAPDPRRGYLIPADSVRRVEAAAARAGLLVIGFFHSHPDGSALPSRRDLADAWPGYLYMIVPAVPCARPTAWRLGPDRARFRPVSWLPVAA